MSGTVADLGEVALIEAVAARLGSSPAVRARARRRRGRRGRRRRPGRRRPPTCWSRAGTSSATGPARPTSASVPPPPTSPTSRRWAPCRPRCWSASPCRVDLPAQWVLELADGLGEEAARAGAAVAGGDLVRGDLVTIAVTALGSLEGRDPVTRVRRAARRPGRRRRPARLGRGRLRGPVPRLPVAPHPGRRAPATGAAVRRGTARRRPRRHRDGRRQRRPGQRPGPRRAGQRGRRSGCRPTPSTCRRSSRTPRGP